jgi:hypothetical protein
MTGLSFGLENKLFNPALLFSWSYASKIGTRLLKDVLGPVGCAAAIYGLVVAWRRERWAEPLGIAAFLGYLAMVTDGNFAHNYYQLPVVPVATVLVALGATDAVRRVGDRRAWTGDRRVAALAVVVWLAAVSTFVRAASFHSWYEVDRTRARFCEELTRVLAPDQRVAFAHDGSPDILFCIDRKGWLLGDHELTAERLSELLGRDALIVTPARFEETVGLLETIGSPVAVTPEFRAYGAR